jgi:hypothetical protein
MGSSHPSHVGEFFKSSLECRKSSSLSSSPLLTYIGVFVNEKTYPSMRRLFLILEITFSITSLHPVVHGKYHPSSMWASSLLKSLRYFAFLSFTSLYFT